MLRQAAHKGSAFPSNRHALTPLQALMAGPLPQAQKGALDILKDVADAHLKEASRLNKDKLVIGGCACMRTCV